MPRPPSVLSTRCAQSYEHGGGWSGGQWDSGEEMGNRPCCPTQPPCASSVSIGTGEEMGHRPPGYRHWVFLISDLFSLRFSSPPFTGPTSLEFSGRTRCSLTTTSLASQTLASFWGGKADPGVPACKVLGLPWVQQKLQTQRDSPACFIWPELCSETFEFVGDLGSKSFHLTLCPPSWLGHKQLELVSSYPESHVCTLRFARFCVAPHSLPGFPAGPCPRA